MVNAIVKGWLIGAMEPDLMNLYVPMPIPKSIWTALSQTYYEGTDRSAIYDLSRRVMQMSQDGRPVSIYYPNLRAIWKELEYRKPITFSQPKSIKLNKRKLMKNVFTSF